MARRRGAADAFDVDARRFAAGVPFLAVSPFLAISAVLGCDPRRGKITERALD
ncbi:MAG TPA: hypothetical protein VIL20_02005 [Sandaracinaceae bacterium]